MCQRSYAEAEGSEIHISHRFRFQEAKLVQAVLEATDAVVGLDGGRPDTPSKELLVLYLWSLGCLLDNPSGDAERTAIDVRFRWFRSNVAHFLSVDKPLVTRVPDYLSFGRLSVLPLEGDEIVIKPQYHSTMSQEFGNPHIKIEYKIGSNHPWLHWDPNAGAFRGRIPHFSQFSDIRSGPGQVCRINNQGSYAVVYLLRIEVKAFAVVAYASSRVRLERTVRARVSLRTLPPTPRQGDNMLNRMACLALDLLALESGTCDQKTRSRDKVPGRESGRTSDAVEPVNPACPGYQSGCPSITDHPDLQPCLPPHQRAPNGNTSPIPESGVMCGIDDGSHFEVPVKSTGQSNGSDKEDSHQSVIHADKHDEEAMTLDTQYSPRSPKRNHASRWIDAPVSPKALKSGLNVRSMSHESDADHDEDKENVPEKDARSAPLLDFLIKLGKKPQGKSSTIRQKLISIRDVDVKENPSRPSQTGKKSRPLPAPEPSNKGHGSLVKTRNESGARYQRLPLSENPNIRGFQSEPAQQVKKIPPPQSAEKRRHVRLRRFHCQAGAQYQWLHPNDSIETSGHKSRPAQQVNVDSSPEATEQNNASSARARDTNDYMSTSSYSPQPAPQVHEKSSPEAMVKSSPPPPLEFSNRFTPLQDLSSGSSIESPSDGGDSNPFSFRADTLSYSAALRKHSGNVPRSRFEVATSSTANAASTPLPSSPARQEDETDGGYQTLSRDDSMQMFDALRMTPGSGFNRSRELLTEQYIKMLIAFDDSEDLQSDDLDADQARENVEDADEDAETQYSEGESDKGNDADEGIGEGEEQTEDDSTDEGF